MCQSPTAAMAANHTRVMGPKKAATRPVPCACTRNRPTMITSVSGSTKESKSGVMTLRPSMAESTEIAGVMIASP